MIDSRPPFSPFSAICRLMSLVAFARYSVYLMVIALTCVGATETVNAERWYGNLVLTGQRTRTTPVGSNDGSMYQAHANVNVEDVLFYKNRLRVAGNFDWRREASGYKEYRPIYYGDLFGYGYAINTSYSPYKRKGVWLGGGPTGSLVEVTTHDWRSSLAVTVPKYPSLSIVYNRVKSFDKLGLSASNYLQHTTVVESGYSRNFYSLRGNYYRVQNKDLRNAYKSDVVKAASGTVSGTSPASRYGNASITFNYYNTRRSLADTVLGRGQTGSIAAMAATSYVKYLSAMVSYSGRFTGSKVGSISSPNSRAEAISASLGYAPTSYFDFQAVKGYQIDGIRTQYDITEYITLTANASRYLRQGVETRMSLTRTYYQQSNRTQEFRDSLGALDSTRRINNFTIDTWYGSIGFAPAPYTKASAGLTISRDSYPLQVDRRYQMTGTIDARLALRRNLEGRLSYSSNYIGSRLRIGHAFSETYNVGLAWLPRNNVNVNTSYIYSAYNTLVRNTSSTFNVYAGYTYRRVYSLSVSYNRRGDDQQIITPAPDTTSSGHPGTFNGQLLIYLSPRATFTIGYLRDTGAWSDVGRRMTRTWQGLLNIQL